MGDYEVLCRTGSPRRTRLPQTASRAVAITTRAQTFPEQKVLACLPPSFIHIQLWRLIQREGSASDTHDDDGHFYFLCQQVEP